MDTTTAVTGRYTDNGRPLGSTSITPHIVVDGAEAAIEFYREVFGATIDDVTFFGDAVAHAELDFGLGRLTLSDPIESYGLVAPSPNGASFSLALYVPDVDRVVEAATEAGATVREPATTFVSGDRFASIVDPFGIRWTIMTRVEDISPEESRRRVSDWAASQS